MLCAWDSKDLCFSRRMAAKKKEVVLQVSRGQALKSFKLNKCKGWDSVLGYLRFCWRSPTVRSLWCKSIPESGREDGKTWQVKSVSQIQWHRVQREVATGLQVLFWICYKLGRVWLLSYIKMHLCFHYYLRRGEEVPENSLVYENIEKAKAGHESLLPILKKVQSSQERNTEADWTC